MRLTSITPFVLALTAAVPAAGQSGPEAVPSGIDPGWVDAVTEDLRRAEYEPHAAGGEHDLTAANHAQGYRISFSADGLRIASRSDAETTFEWSLELDRFGRDGALAPVDAPRVTADGNRVEYTRGALVEWYVNDERGVEQGFTVRRRPAGGDASIVVELAVAGTLTARPAETRIDYLTDDGAVVVRYDKLLVIDADGRELPATMTGDAASIRLEVDDRDARYPIVIDPLIDNPHWEIEGNLANAYFGWSVGTAGDLDGDGFSDVIVGAPFFNAVGQVRVFLGDAAGLETIPAVTLNGSAPGQEFGYSVGTAGDVDGDGLSDVIIGRRSYTGAITGQGGAVIYRGIATGTVLSLQPHVQLTVAQSNAFFGTSVSTAGDVNGDGFSDVIVGAPRAEKNQTREGLAYVFHGGASMSTTPATTLESTDDFANFGISVSTAGDVDADGFSDVIVGAPNFNNGSVDEGFAAIHHGSAGGVAVVAEWSKETNLANARFGAAVGTAGDVNGDGYSDVVVGSPGFAQGETEEGWAFVYRGSSGTASIGPDWQAQIDVANAHFGAAVGTAGDVNGDGYADLSVGAPGYTTQFGTQILGKVFVYHGGYDGLSTEPAFERTLNEPLPEFGNAVATAGDVNGDGYSDVIFGARSFSNGQTNEGRAQVHLGSPGGPAPTAARLEEGGGAGRWLGSSVASAGDVNGDGFGDWIAGEPRYSNGDTDEGRALLYLGNTATTSTAMWSFESNQIWANLGQSVSTAGDLNGDGYADVIVGAPKAQLNGGPLLGGGIYTFLGSAAGPSATPSFTSGSIQADSDLGYSVSVAGDVNGDGFCDIVYGAPLRDNGQTDEGQAFVFHGGATPSGISGGIAWTDEGDQDDARFGFSVSTAGDVNGDGFSDVLIGAPGYDAGLVDTGRAFYYFGSAAGLSAEPGTFVNGTGASDQLGHSVSEAGDFNADGFPDAIFGAPFFGSIDGGSATICAGSSGLSSGFVPTQIGGLIIGGANQARLGWSVSSAGDVNADGFADTIVGAPWTATSGNNGFASINFGSVVGPTGLYGTQHNRSSGTADDLFGHSVAGAGDVNGDGYADVLIGAPEHDGGAGANTGAWSLFLGNEAANIIRFRTLPRQRRGNDGGPIPLLGVSPINGVQLFLKGHSPFGRGKASLHYELFKAAGTLSAFGGSAETDLGLGQTELTANVAGVAEGLYSWRVRLAFDKASTPYQSFGPWRTVPWNGGTEADLRVKHVPANLTLESAAAVTATHELKTAPPAPVIRKIKNIGGFALNWKAIPSAPWVTVAPAAGAGLLAGDPSPEVSIGFDPSKLPAGQEVGTHAAKVRFENANDAADFVDVQVSLAAAYKLFVPGDLLVGQIDGPADTLAASSEGYKGMGLKVTFQGAAEKMKLLVTVQGGGKSKTKKVTVKPGKKKKLTLKLKSDGLYGVTIRSTKGVGPLQIQTAVKVHKLAKPSTVKLTSKSPTAQVRALPGGTLSATLLPNGKFAGPLSLTVRDPAFTTLDTGAFQQPAGNGGLALLGLPLPLAGTYSLQVGGNGFGSKKAKVVVTLTPTQPPPGTSTIVLP